MQRRGLNRLVAMLAPRVALLSDGGGVARAARRPIQRVEPVVRLLAGIARKYSDSEVAMAELNGGPGLVMTARGEPIATVQLGVRNGRIEQIWSMRNPAKLAALTAARQLITG